MTNPAKAHLPNALPAATQLVEMILGKARTQLIAIAAELGIADLLVDGPRSIEELAETAGAHAPSLYRVMRALASLGVFAEIQPRVFALTPLAELLRDDAPGSLRSYAVMHGSECFFRPWSQLLHGVRTGESAFEKTFGTGLFDYLQQHPGESAAFNDAMTSISRQQAVAVCDAYDFSDFGTIVDVGGGHGLLLGAILKAHPSAMGLLHDLPSVVEGARASIEAEGLNDRCRIVGSDFFRDVPGGGDAYIMKFILHDWDDVRAGKILKNCREAMAPGGRALVLEAVIPPGDAPFVGKLGDINMLVLTQGGRERTEAEFGDLFASAGLRLTRIVPTASHVSVIEGATA